MTAARKQILRIARERRVVGFHLTAALIIASVNGDAAALEYIRTCPVPGPVQRSLLST